MNLLLWIIFGGLAGVIAALLTKTNQGVIVDIILGVVGAIVGGFIMNVIGFPGITGFNIYSLIVAVIGALLLISIGKLFQKRV